MFDMLVAKELLVRAWDSSMNTQPAAITWNLTGMMNNCYHRWVSQGLLHPVKGRSVHVTMGSIMIFKLPMTLAF